MEKGAQGRFALLSWPSVYYHMSHNNKTGNQTRTASFSVFPKRSVFGHSTHEGVAKKPNEDAHSAFSISFGNEECHVLIVADGVTSESGSQQASHLAIEAIRQTIEMGIQALPTSFSHHDLRLLLEQAIIQADRRIKEVARSHAIGMSTTVVVTLIIRNTLYTAHVGDSRAYLYRNQSIHLLTQDHTYVEEMIQQGKLERKEAKQKANRNVLTRYLGPGPVPKVDLALISPDNTPESQRLTDHMNLLPGDAILLCSDGLVDKVTEVEISRILSRNQHHLQRSTNQLIQKALEKHEQDNITAVLFRLPHQGEEYSYNRVLLWLVGLFLLTFLVAFAVIWQTIFFPSVQIPQHTAIVQLVGTEETLPLQSPTPLSTHPAIMTSYATDAPILLPTVTPFLASSPTPLLWESERNHSITKTVTPIPTFTSPPVPTFTSTLIPTLPSQAIVNKEDVTDTLAQEKPVTNSLSISVSNQISPALMAISIDLISPGDGATIAGRQMFKWATNITDLPPNYAFELIFWEIGQDPLEKGQGLIETDKTSLDGVEVDLTNHKVLTHAGTYLWGIRIVKLDPDEKIRFLGKQHTFVFKP